jgi:hypothetical protein
MQGVVKAVSPFSLGVGMWIPSEKVIPFDVQRINPKFHKVVERIPCTLFARRKSSPESAYLG